MEREHDPRPNKHNEFVNLLRSSMVTSELQVTAAYATVEIDAENETDYVFMRQLEKKLNELLGLLD